MKYIVCFSGGHSSAIAAIETVRKYGNRLGAEIARYYATEIDKYAIQTTQHNYPETVQLGDAFQVRQDEWWAAREERE